MELDTIIQATQSAVARNDWKNASNIINGLPYPDIATVLGHVSTEEALQLLRRCQQDKQSIIFGYLEPSIQSSIAQLMNRSELTALFEKMDHDERADLYNRLSEEERQSILPGLAHAEREDIRNLASYEEGTIGAIMTSAYVSLHADLTVTEALERIRLEAPDAETIYQIYIIDKQRHLEGTASLRDLLLANQQATLRDIMVKEVIHARADEDQNEAATQIAHYDLLALPVVDDQQRMVGIVTHDDALDVAQEESAEDQMRLGAVTGQIGGKLNVSLKDASIWLLYRMRVFWLVVLVFGNIFSGAGIAHFEELIESMVTLVFFLPLLVDSGGNAGSQSATLMVRALATGDVRGRDWFSMLGKEISVALLLGLSMALAVSVIGVYRGGIDIALVVSLTMVIIVIVGSVIGMSLPFLFTKFKLDPASASAPLITSICDATGVLIYFNIASMILEMPAV